MKDPFDHSIWYAFGIVAVVILLVYAHRLLADDSKPDGPADDVYCQQGWCLVKQDTLAAIANALTLYQAKEKQLTALCGWKEKN